MPRCARVAPGGVVYHTLNRAVAQSTLFKKDGDYGAFERAGELSGVPLLASVCARATAKSPPEGAR